MINHFEKIYDIENFDKYNNFYTILKRERISDTTHLCLIYGHFFDDRDLFVYKTVYNNDIQTPYIDEFNKCSIDDLLPSSSDRYYRFDSYEAAKYTMSLIKNSI